MTRLRHENDVHSELTKKSIIKASFHKGLRKIFTYFWRYAIYSTIANQVILESTLNLIKLQESFFMNSAA